MVWAPTATVLPAVAGQRRLQAHGRRAEEHVAVVDPGDERDEGVEEAFVSARVLYIFQLPAMSGRRPRVVGAVTRVP